MNPMMCPTINPAIIEPANENLAIIDPANENNEMINPIIKIKNFFINKGNDMKLNYYIPKNYEYEPNYPIKIMYIDTEEEMTYNFIVFGSNSTTIENLIKKFRILLSNDNILIKKYLLNDTIELDPHSNQKLLEFGINDKSIIKAIK